MHIASLGSSFAAGPGLQPLLNVPAGRSAINYPHLLATSLNAELTDLTISGATLLSILSEPQTCKSITFPPQLNGLPPDVDIVTVTAGGNDLGYVGGLMSDTLWNMWGLFPFGWLLHSRLSKEIKPTKDELVKRFLDVIDGIHIKAPKAKIYLVGYLTILGNDTKSGVNTVLTKDQIVKWQKKAEDLRECYKLASESRKGICEFVDMSEVSFEHGVGSNEEWVCGFNYSHLWNGTAPYHPTKRGMEVVADILKGRIERNHK